MDINYFHISLSKSVRELVFFQPTFSDASAVNIMYLWLDTEIRKNDKMTPWIIKGKRIEKTKVHFGSVIKHGKFIYSFILRRPQKIDEISKLF